MKDVVGRRYRRDGRPVHDTRLRLPSATSGLLDFFFQSVALDRKRGGENGQGVDRNMT
jgi:hypothetical protein